ncbi:hypothetical protein BDV28DRAFT_50371 [Aspergillus coremiiformis]|uniref:Uncharacterized protein n=1 Tax=Aspergillus coremiiformis TaxID=138285 RepID=A0A5N6YWZ4_9EURO|nr:hypothetical protein BDV28DRAFT_50371 [Aspergillus coremiiformis]
MKPPIDAHVDCNPTSIQTVIFLACQIPEISKLISKLNPSWKLETLVLEPWLSGLRFSHIDRYLYRLRSTVCGVFSPQCGHPQESFTTHILKGWQQLSLGHIE